MTCLIFNYSIDSSVRPLGNLNVSTECKLRIHMQGVAYLTDKYREVIVGINKMKNYHRTYCREFRLVGKNRKNRRREDSEPNEESRQTNGRFKSTVVEEKKPSPMQISHAYGKKKVVSKYLLVSIDSRALNFIRNNMSKYTNDVYSDMHLIYIRDRLAYRMYQNI